ncbi:membrane protein insertase YidC [Alisedimentitalea sp. MJ-SS2]|uniref:membrane protein insertase YidC n=1 Tax=Aliisedimentitalea sp. MJ-SS2 TaxID=3049795 RepID=UPI00290ABA0E|nr:membrane protein insertase YidC [Alisedimentitalea sp. MJ-SS2]MDU8928430.1 membrane protein insertase YidC [Alisedimentitalea sp. MJ-SS2]
MEDQNKNLILAIALSMLVIIGWSIMFPPPEPPVDPTDPAATTAATGTTPTAETPATGGPVADAPAGATPATSDDTASALETAPRVKIETPSVTGTISLLGGRIDQLSLKDYRDTLDEGSDIVTLLSPFGTDQAYYALYGWAPGAGLAPEDVPGPNTLWSVENGDSLTPSSPITLSWANSKGMTFRRTISVDDKFMFNVTQSVENGSDDTVSMAPYGILARHGEPADMKNFFILHEGVVAMADGELAEIDYDDIVDYPLDPNEGAKAEVTRVTQSGWIGFTDHYWMTTLIPADGAFKSVTKYDDRRNIFQTETVQSTQQLTPGTRVEVSSRLFAGAKEWAAIRTYENEHNVKGFLDSIDWGWFFFLTKPMFALLHWLNGLIGNMGWAIIALTVVIKVILFPLAYKSYASMAKMRELQPQMEKIKETAGDDRQKLQQEMMALYKKEKVNPASGCLPILLQIPIFFSLYKVIFVTLELRHAPWVGWINDLSAPDPSSLFNLFGILPWDGPEPGSIMAILFLGIMPIALGVSMWLQQKLNPAPTDPVQKQIFAWMPWVFMFMLGSFASGLVLYWIANNVITFTQQYLIMRSHGYKPNVFGNIRSSLKRDGGDSA